MKTAFVLAAGKGERMMPLTKTTPKPLLKINGTPMMVYILKLLEFNDFKNIGVNLFYLGKQIQNYFNKGKKHGVNITYINENYLSGSAGGVKKIFEKLRPKKPFLVIASDMMTNFDLTDIYRFHLNHDGIATICCYLRDKSSLQSKKSGLILFNKKTKQIKKFVERPQDKKDIFSFWVNSSVYIFNPEIVELIPNSVNGSKVVDLAKDIFPKILNSNYKMYAYPVDKKKYYQLGIDNPKRIKTAEKDIRNGTLTLS